MFEARKKRGCYWSRLIDRCDSVGTDTGYQNYSLDCVCCTGGFGGHGPRLISIAGAPRCLQCVCVRTRRTMRSNRKSFVYLSGIQDKANTRLRNGKTFQILLHIHNLRCRCSVCVCVYAKAAPLFPCPQMQHVRMWTRTPNVYLFIQGNIHINSSIATHHQQQHHHHHHDPSYCPRLHSVDMHDADRIVRMHIIESMRSLWLAVVFASI